MGMKKILSVSITLLSLLAVAVSVTPAQANTKSLVIVDSYFDSRIGDTPIICITSNPCVNDTRVASRALTAPANHGVAMVDVVRSKFPSVSVIALRTADARTEMNVGHLVAALTWAVQNKDRVAALSISRAMNGPDHNKTGCSAAATNTAHLGGVTKADVTVRALITELKNSGIPVFVSAGNGRGNIVDYPACIIDTNSVSTGAKNSLGAIVSTNKFNESTDHFLNLANNGRNVYGNIFKLIPNTTSTATALAAAKYVSESNLETFISILP